MQDFPSVKVPIGLFFAHVAARLQPRYYSISSSPLRHPSHCHVTAAVVDEVMPTGRRHLGVASGTLSKAKSGDLLPVFIRKSTFRLPQGFEKPIILIGPGTGLAPFRGFLQERAEQVHAGQALGPAYLFFGCRHPEEDYIYQEELEAALRQGILTGLNVAFSRVSNSKDYVQHHLLHQRCDVWEALQAGGSMYVCGDAKHMAKDVHKAVNEVVARCNGWAMAEAEAHVAKLQKEGRYLQDVW
jgi:NADPH-ferrihemoprotein reductase